MNDFDDRIRDGLAGGPADAPPPPAFAEVEHRARRTTRRRRVMAGGALLGSLAIAAGILAMQQPEDDQTVVVTQPESTTSTSTSNMTTSTTTTTTSPPVQPGPTRRPERVVVATAEGRLLVLDLASGRTVTELGTYSTDLTPPEGSPSLIDDIAVTADGSVALVSLCCEPAAGRIAIVPTDGSAPLDPDGRMLTNALYARPGPPNRPWLAFDSLEGIAVTMGLVGTDPDLDLAVDVPHTVAGGTRGLAWSPDGQRLAWQEGRELVVAEVVDDAVVRVIHRHQTPADRYWLHPTFRADGDIVVLHGATGVNEGEPTTEGAVVDIDSGEVTGTIELPGAAWSARYDHSGNWLLAVLWDGRLVIAEADGSWTTISEDVRAADWMPSATDG